MRDLRFGDFPIFNSFRRLGYFLSTIVCLALATGSARAQSAQVELTFSAPGDDGLSGRAAAYEIRYSTSPINQGNWNQATPVPETAPAPAFAGNQEHINVSVPNALLGTTYHFAVRTRDEAFNWSPVSNDAPFTYTIGSGTGDDEASLPVDFELHVNYPNPFNAGTRIEFDVPRASSVQLTVFNALGRRIRDLLDTHLAAGSYGVTWDGTDGYGRSVPSGTYFYQLASVDFLLTRRMTLLK